jgi:hypothetical protein
MSYLDLAKQALQAKQIPPEIIPDTLPPDWHLFWDERAAFMEYDGSLPRERAEFLALVDTIRAMREAGDQP